jgi:Tol biopolymer transport system component
MDPLKPASGKLVLVVKGGGWGASDWSPDDRQLLVGEFLSVNQSRYHLVDVASGRSTPLVPDERDTVAYSGARFSGDGRGVYLTTDAGSEFQRLGYLDLATRRITPLTASINWDIDGFDVSADGRTIACVANEAGVSRLYLLDTQSRRIRPVPNLPIGSIGGARWHRRLPVLAFTVSSARSPSDVYSLDARTGTVTRWTDSEASTTGRPTASPVSALSSSTFTVDRKGSTNPGF